MPRRRGVSERPLETWFSETTFIVTNVSQQIVQQSYNRVGLWVTGDNPDAWIISTKSPAVFRRGIFGFNDVRSQILTRDDLGIMVCVPWFCITDVGITANVTVFEIFEGPAP